MSAHYKVHTTTQSPKLDLTNHTVVTYNDSITEKIAKAHFNNQELEGDLCCRTQRRNRQVLRMAEHCKEHRNGVAFIGASNK
jgi:hypothetical protein